MGNAAPLISVITIVRNNEELLPRAVDSMLEQNFTDFEHIIVNDGSTDGTMAIIDDYAGRDLRVKPQHLPQNVGRAMARNAGLDAAKGKYLFFLDSDDYLPQTALNDLFEIAEEDNAEIVFGKLKCFDQLTGIWLQDHYTYKIINKEKHKFRLDEHIDLVDNHHIVGRLYKRELLEANGIRFSTERKNGEDVAFAFFTVFYAKILSMVPSKIVYYYSQGNYLAAANEAKLLDSRDNMLDVLDFVLKHGSDLLKHRLRQKGAMFAGSLERAQIVYGGDETKFKTYLTTLVPFVQGLTEDVLTSLPSYFRCFAQALQLYDFDKAFLLWDQRNEVNFPQYASTDIQEIERLRAVNKELAQRLARIHNTWSWRITAPLRRIVSSSFMKKYKHQSTAKHVISASKPVTLKPGLDMSLEFNGSGFGQHRSGWKAVAMESLKPLHDPEAVYFVSFLEKIFVWGKPKPVVFPRSWIGFTHRPHNIPSFFPSEMRRLFYQNEYFADVLPDCRGIFTLSNYHAKHIAEKLSIPVESLILPTEIPERQWDPGALSNTKIKVVQVGWWLRKLHGIFMLPSGNYEKIYLTKRSVEPVDRLFSVEAEYLRNKGLFKNSMYDSAKTMDFLPDDEYDSLLANCIIFLDLYDASANNAIVEGIARAAPILVNPIAPIVEYLGEDYPLYYNSYEEAVEKLHDRTLLHAAHDYLKNCPTRKKLSGSYFRKSLEESEIYKSIING